MSTPNSDDAAEMDQFREQLGEFDNTITKDTGNVVEYICAEGDPPFIHYRLTLESFAEHTLEELEIIRHQLQAAAE